MIDIDIAVSITDIIANISVIVGVGLTVIQIRIFVKQRIFDDLRKKQVATIEYSDTKLDEAKKLNKEIYELLGKEKISPLNTAYQENKNNIQTTIKCYLNIMTRLSAGILEDVYDIKLFTQLSGGWIIASHDRLSDIIIDRRKINKDEGLFRSFDKAVNIMRKTRNTL